MCVCVWGGGGKYICVRGVKCVCVCVCVCVRGVKCVCVCVSDTSVIKQLHIQSAFMLCFKNQCTNKYLVHWFV